MTRVSTGVTLTFTEVNALTALLTTESLLFAAFGVAIGLGSSAAALTLQAPAARKLAVVSAVVLTFVGAGAMVAWTELFIVSAWPARFGEWFPVVAIAVGIVAQPTFAGVFAWRLYQLPARP
jgi:hypothetical protein